MLLTLIGAPGLSAGARTGDGNTRTLVELPVITQPAYHPLAEQRLPRKESDKPDHQQYEYRESHSFPFSVPAPAVRQGLSAMRTENLTIRG